MGSVDFAREWPIDIFVFHSIVKTCGVKYLSIVYEIPVPLDEHLVLLAQLGQFHIQLV